MALRNELNGTNVNIDVLAALTHLNEMLEYENGMTRLQEAQKTENIDTLNQLYENAKTYLSNPDEIKKINNIDASFAAKQKGLSLLFWAIACYQPAEEIAKLIADEKSVAEVYCIDGINFTPIFYAMQIGHITGMVAMVQAWPSLISRENDSGLTPAHQATRTENTTALKALHSANPQAIRVRDRSGHTPLDTAISLRLPNIARFLAILDKPIENEPLLTNMCDQNNRSPLATVVLEHPLDELTLAIINDVLLNHGADCHLATNEKDPMPNTSALQMIHDRSRKLRTEYTELKQSEDTLLVSNPAYLYSKELTDLKNQLEMAEQIVKGFIYHSVILSKEFRVASALLHYIDEREQKPVHITDNTKVGKYKFVSGLFSAVAKIADDIGVPILYTIDNKIDACRQLLANIINGVKNPLQQLPEYQQKALGQGSLAKLVAPLQPALQPSVQKEVGRTSLRSSH